MECTHPRLSYFDPTRDCPDCRGRGVVPDPEPADDVLTAEADAQRAEDLREYERERFADVCAALREYEASERAQRRIDADIALHLGWDEFGRPHDER